MNSDNFDRVDTILVGGVRFTHSGPGEFTPRVANVCRGVQHLVELAKVFRHILATEKMEKGNNSHYMTTYLNELEKAIESAEGNDERKTLGRHG